MKKANKAMLGLLLGFSLGSAHAQLRTPGTANPDVKNALETVITDLPKEFASLKGEVIVNNPQTVEYASLLRFKSAEQNVITKHSGKRPVYSWQAVMATTEDFSAAAKKYKSLYGQLKGTSLTLNRDYSYSLAGEYDAPDESKKFSTTVFRLLPSASNLPKVKVELSMQYELLEWKVYLTVYQKEREDADRGPIEE